MDCKTGIYNAMAVIVRNLVKFPCSVRERNDSEHSFTGSWPELILQSVWNDQLIGGELHTADGRVVRVVHPGIWNFGEGPDFQRAILEFDGARRHGDVEVHHRPSMWYAHGHHENDLYDNVILHVVLDRGRPDATSESEVRPLPPCLELRSLMTDDTIATIESLSLDSYSYADKIRPGGCAAHFARMSDDQVRHFLRTAGLSRFKAKVDEYLKPMVCGDSEAAAYIAFMDALGYHANRVQFKALAMHCGLRELRSYMNEVERCAYLFGVSGFLRDPTRLNVKDETKNILREVWDCWWRLGLDALDIDWHHAGVRPSNQPAPRLFAGWRLLEKWQYRPLHEWMRAGAASTTGKELIEHLRVLLEAPANENVRKLASALVGRHGLGGGNSPRLGRSRTLDVLCNVVLPLIAARARQTKRVDLERLAEEAYLALPKLQRNRTFKEMGHRLLMPPGRLRVVLSSAAEQQGLISVYRDFCEPQGGDCSQCPLSEWKHVEKMVS